MARVSYALYLLQEPALVVKTVLLERAGYPPTGWMAMAANFTALIATGIAAALSWWLYESRFIRFGYRFSYQRPLERPAPASAGDRVGIEVGGAT